MSVQTATSTRSRADERARTLLKWMLRDYHPRDFAVRWPDGEVWPVETAAPTFTIVLKHSGSLRRMFWPPRGLTLAEAYLFDDYDLEGDIETWWLFANHLRERYWSIADRVRFFRDLRRLPRRLADDRSSSEDPAARVNGAEHSAGRDRQSIQHHYDVSNEFYKLWLDRRCVYTCAYFPTPDADLDAAQEHKLEHVCRKLRLRPGDRLLDLGCGWGSLAIYAAERYGVDVVGVTVSDEQVRLGRQRVEEAGLTGRVDIKMLDYRHVPGEAVFDKVVSVGMLEHVGDGQFPSYLASAWRLLKPGGVLLSHGIALNTDRTMPTPPTFASKYVFPNGELLRLSRNLEHCEEAGFEVRDVESLRDHYHLTCRHWLRRLEARAEEARDLVGEATYRVWRLYLAISALGFRVGWFNLYQTLLVKAPDGRASLPLTRDDWYMQ